MTDVDLLEEVSENPEVALTLAKKMKPEAQSYLLRVLKEERPEWYSENVSDRQDIEG